MGQLQSIQKELGELGLQLLAISPDTPEGLRTSAKKHETDFLLLSDSKMEAAKRFGIAYEVNAKTLKRLSGFGIDVEAASGEDHHLLPVPSVFIADKDGSIAFSYVNPDYRKRLDSEVLLAAARSAARK